MSCFLCCFTVFFITFAENIYFHDMKTLKHIFLLLFTISFITCCDKDKENVIPESKDIILSDNHNNVLLKRKGHWGNSNNRVYQSTYSSDSPENCSFKGKSLHINFIKEIKELNLCIRNINTQEVFEDTFSAKKNSTYPIPLTFIKGEEYVIEIICGSELYYLIFTIK